MSEPPPIKNRHQRYYAEIVRRCANDLSRNFASRSIKMIPRGASVGKIRREATKPVSTFAGRDESQERWKDGKAEAKVLSSKPNPPYCALAGSAYRSKAPVIGAKP